VKRIFFAVTSFVAKFAQCWAFQFSGGGRGSCGGRGGARILFAVQSAIKRATTCTTVVVFANTINLSIVITYFCSHRVAIIAGLTCGAFRHTIPKGKRLLCELQGQNDNHGKMPCCSAQHFPTEYHAQGLEKPLPEN
jgi:hypothetical protein